jgi:hypothetical protein
VVQGGTPVLFLVPRYCPGTSLKDTDVKHAALIVHFISDLSGGSVGLLNYLHLVRYLLFSSTFETVKQSLIKIKEATSHDFLT